MRYLRHGALAVAALCFLGAYLVARFSRPNVHEASDWLFYGCLIAAGVAVLAWVVPPLYRRVVRPLLVGGVRVASSGGRVVADEARAVVRDAQSAEPQ